MELVQIKDNNHFSKNKNTGMVVNTNVSAYDARRHKVAYEHARSIEIIELRNAIAELKELILND